MLPGSSRIFVLLVSATALAVSGCVISRPGSTCRIWADCNTLGAPALFIEETDHLPYPAPRVEYFRWMYNAGTLVQRYAGAVPSVSATIDAPQLVPHPGEPPAQEGEPLDSQLPPLPAEAGIDRDPPARSRPAPQSAPSTNDDGDGPTAARNRARN